MKLVALPVFLTLFLVAALAMNFSSAVFLYLLLNFLIWFIIFWSYKPCKEELELWPPSLPSCGDENAESSWDVAGDTYVNIKGENAESSWDVAGDTYVNSKGENAESSWDVAGDNYVNVKGEDGINEKAQDNSNGIDNDDEKHSCSDGCNYEDDNSNGSAAEIGWQDVDEQFDENLEKRIEEFIAKVNNGWRKEKLRDK
ncbi:TRANSMEMBRANE PROTEIN [Salix viminalis]|uniref:TRANSMEMBRANE PROTEIN n=1 Tax=Salix viminalis TaxID=40686 RepID=A0A9Q0NKN7_SALVM|nr:TRANSMEMBRANE PROTEIN [Salix viminalis]